MHVHLFCTSVIGPTSHPQTQRSILNSTTVEKKRNFNKNKIPHYQFVRSILPLSIPPFLPPLAGKRRRSCRCSRQGPPENEKGEDGSIHIDKPPTIFSSSSCRFIYLHIRYLSNALFPRSNRLSAFLIFFPILLLFFFVFFTFFIVFLFFVVIVQEAHHRRASSFSSAKRRTFDRFHPLPSIQSFFPGCPSCIRRSNAFVASETEPSARSAGFWAGFPGYFRDGGFFGVAHGG